MPLPAVPVVLGAIGAISLAYYIGSEIADLLDPGPMCELQGSNYFLEQDFYECTYRCGDGRLITIRTKGFEGCPGSFPPP